MQRHLYPDNWKERVQEADCRAGGRCEGCGAVLGTLRVSRKGNLYFLPLHTSHVNHDPENPQAELRKPSPTITGPPIPGCMARATTPTGAGTNPSPRSGYCAPRALVVWPFYPMAPVQGT